MRWDGQHGEETQRDQSQAVGPRHGHSVNDATAAVIKAVEDSLARKAAGAVRGTE